MTTSRSALRVAVTHLVYDLLFGLVALLVLPVWCLRGGPDGRAWVAGRLGRLPGTPPAGRPVWIHAVSVGEVKAARPLVAAFRARHPATPLVLSTGTATGLQTARREFPDQYVFLAPLDLAFVVRRVLRRIDPRLLVLLELEAWPAWMRLADEAGVPQVIVNGRITESSARRYRRLAWLLPEWERLDLVAVQDEVQRQRVEALGVAAERVVVTGNLKHAGPPARDRPSTQPPDPRAALARELGLDAGLPVFVAGSTHDGEDELVLDAWLAAGAGAASRLVLVTRHLERLGDIERMLERRGAAWARRTALPDGTGSGDPERVVLVDTMGELEALFALADVVFLGGSLVPVGGHNVLEPAAAGVPVLVGPHLETCRADAELLREAGSLRIVSDGPNLGTQLAALLRDPSGRAAAGAAGRAVVAGLQGAAEADWALIEQQGLLPEPSGIAGCALPGTDLR